MIARTELLHLLGARISDTELLDLVRAVDDRPASVVARRARVLSLDDLAARPRVQWVVRGLLPAGVSFLVSPPNCGKSALAVDWALRCATGSEWHGRRVRAGGVIYVAGEGLAGLGDRIAAWRGAHCTPSLVHRLDVVEALPPLSTPIGLDELRGIAAEHADLQGSPVLVVIDTLATHWAESENDSERVGPCMAGLAAIAQQHGCAVLLLHHERKQTAGAPRGDAWASLRGSGAWAGAADAVLSLRADGDAIELAATKMRDGERGAPIRLSIVAADVPCTLDEDGVQVRAPIVVPAPQATPVDAEVARLASDADAEARVLAALRAMGSTTRVDAVVRKAGLRLTTGRDAWDRLRAADRVVPIGGTSRAPIWAPADEASGSVEAASPPYPPSTGRLDLRVGRSRLDDVPDVAGTSRTSRIIGGQP